MAIIPLRQYNREIEGLIDTGQLDEAVAHCRHILELFPKHIATYRLLGKAYLEQQRFGDAADIFQRVLSSLPDDHVANIGMSIIREDEGNLDAAIWYMERALEAQPSNAAIKDELRRLYGRRDGIEPPKIRLTRGALARMYSRGGLYDQAIAELRSALADDPQRPDLMVLLAEMYYHLGQQVEAVDTCGNLIKKLPYCLMANRILASILPQTGRADDTKTYHHRVIAMDPYFSTAAPNVLSSDSVPEAAITIERLAYRPGEPTGRSEQPAWAASLGVAFEETPAEQLPDWLKDQELEEQPEKNVLTPSAEPFSWEINEAETQDSREPKSVEDIIPDWMKEAGWHPATGEETGMEIKQPDLFGLEPADEQGEIEIVKADIPDWLKDLAPSGVTDEEKTTDQDVQGEEIDLPWLQRSTPGASDTIVNWLGANKPIEEETAAPPFMPAEPTPEPAIDQGTEHIENGGLPEWLKGIEATYERSGITDWLQSSHLDEFEAASVKRIPDEESAAVPAEEIPEWLKELGESEIELTPAEVPTEEPSAPAEELPQWLKEIGAPEAEAIQAPTEEPAALAEELPGWLKEIREPEIELAPTEAPAEELAAPAEELPEWLKEIGAPEVEAIQAPTEEPASLEEELPGWLKEIGAPEVEAIQAPTEEHAALEEELPGWLKDISEPEIELAPAEAPAEELVAPADELPGWLKEIGAPEVEAIEAPAEEPALPAEELPEWLKEIAAPEAAGFESPAEIPALPAEELPEWLKELPEPDVELAPTKLSAVEPLVPTEEVPGQQTGEVPSVEPDQEAGKPSTEEIPDWLKEINEKSPESPTPFIDQTDQDAALAWLETLAAQHGAKEEEFITKPEERTDIMPEWIKLEAEEIRPEEVSHKPSDTEEMPVPTEQVPEWLKETIETTGEDASTEPSTETPAHAVDLSDQEAALAWLETLAIQHGASEEEMITKPEERLDTMPEWVRLEAEEEQSEEIPTQPTTVDGQSQPGEQLPDWLKEIAEAVEENPIAEAAAPQAPIEPLPEMDRTADLSGAIEEVESLPPQQELEALPDWLKETVAAPQELQGEQPTGGMEELPDWLEDVEQAALSVEQTFPSVDTPSAPPWMPEAIMPEAQLPITEQPIPVPPAIEETKPASSAPEPEQPPVEVIPELINLNTVSLSKLEAMPGIGFMLAQNIIAYRESNGPFTSLDELTNVSGIEPALVDELRAQLTLGIPIVVEEVLPVVETTEMIFTRARKAVEQGEASQASELYNQLVGQKADFDQIIADMQLALYRYPLDINFWQILGDAYLRTDKLQEALDAYTEAEELLR